MTTNNETQNKSNPERLSLPVYIYIELPGECAAQCSLCPIKRGGPRREPISYDSLAEFTGGISKSITKVILTGGEPLNYPEIKNLCRHLDSVKLPYSIMTGSLWNESAGEVINFLKELKYLTNVTFSIHGSDSDAHNFFTQTESFSKVMNALSLCRDNGIPFNTCSVLGSFNKLQIKSLVKTVLSAGSTGHTFQRYIGPIKQSITLYKSDFKQAVSYINGMKKMGLPVKMDNCIPQCCDTEDTFCRAGVLSCTIDQCGNVKGCSFADINFGNITQIPLKSIWKKQTMRKWAETIPEECSLCSASYYCLGGCKSLRERFRIECDPLMEGPVETAKNVEIIISEEILDKPAVKNFRERKEKFGILVMKDEDCIPLSAETKTILKLFDGKTTFREIRQKSEEAFALAALLYQKGYLS